MVVVALVVVVAMVGEAAIPCGVVVRVPGGCLDEGFAGLVLGRGGSVHCSSEGGGVLDTFARHVFAGLSCFQFEGP